MARTVILEFSLIWHFQRVVTASVEGWMPKITGTLPERAAASCLAGFCSVGTSGR
ncbi:hypothetical protein D3C85_1732890 [compost metagenome]